MKYIAEAKVSLGIFDEDIESILGKALDEGIGYWCSGIECGERPADMTLSAWITRLLMGGDRSDLAPQFQGSVEVSILDHNGDPHLLTTDKMIQGIEMMIEGQDSRQDYVYEQGLQCQYIEANLADEIIQYALWGRLVYRLPV